MYTERAWTIRQIHLLNFRSVRYFLFFIFYVYNSTAIKTYYYYYNFFGGEGESNENFTLQFKKINTNNNIVIANLLTKYIEKCRR